VLKVLRERGTIAESRRNTATFPEDEYPTNKGEAAVMEHKWDPDAMRWIPKEQPFSRPKPRQVNRHMLLRGLAEEIVYEDSVAQLYAGRLAAVICDGNPVAQREYEHMLAQERQKAKSLGPI
jgi:hypothetical protein